MENNIIKLLSISLIMLTMVGMAIAKCIYPNMDTNLINSTLLQLLAALGVFHALNNNTPKDPKP